MRRLVAVIQLICLLLVGAVPALAVAAPKDSRGPLPKSDRLEQYEADVPAESVALLQRAGFDVTAVRGQGERVGIDLVLSGRDVGRLKRMGVNPVPRRNEEGETGLQAARAQADGGYEVWRSYGEPGGLADELRAIAAANPRITKLISIGTSVDGTDILAMKVTADARRLPDGKRPAVLYSSLQHAREWIAGEVNMRLLQHVVSGYGEDRELTDLVNGRELWFVPVANPDGYDFTFQPGNRLWRKNLADNDGDGVITGNDGVDPNRNFATNWNYDDEGSSSMPTSAVYRGTAPSSEPETKAMDRLLARIDFAFQVNYHSYGPMLLYPVGYQLLTETTDHPIYEALTGTPERPAVEGFFPTLGAGLYTTNGETTDHAHVAHGTLAWTPELNEGCAGCGFVFPDDEELVEAEFRRNLAFALDVAKSAANPSEPVSHLGNTAPDFVVDTFSESYGSTQTVAVDAKRSLGPVHLRYRINGGRAATVPTKPWKGGERYGTGYDVHYRQLRAAVTGARQGDRVEVWFEAPAGRKRSEAFTYTVVSATGNRVLVLANEDTTGILPSPTGPSARYVGYYLDALAANGVTADVYDVDAKGRRAPHPLGVLSHYDAVVWETGDDLLTRPVGGVPGTIDKLLQDVELAVRDYLNEGGKLLYTGAYAGWQQSQDGVYLISPDDPPGCALYGRALRCGRVSNDFLQYWLGAYQRVAGGGYDPDHELLPLLGTGNVFADARYALNGGDSADNQRDFLLPATASFLTTSSFLPEAQYPHFGPSDPVLKWERDGGAPYEPTSGEWYVYSQQGDVSYKRLTKTVDLRSATSGSIDAKISYSTEHDWDYLFVEARTVGRDDWVTIPIPGVTSNATGDSCAAGWHELHPFLERYQGADCAGAGWNATDGSSDGWTDWSIDLSRFAGEQVEVSISYASDWAVQELGVFVDDAKVVRDGRIVEQTSFEEDLGGWVVAGPPPGSAPNPNDWTRSQTAFEEGAGVATEDTVYLGFGLEGVRNAADRADLMRRALQHLLDD